jgi:hypothetical protein
LTDENASLCVVYNRRRRHYSRRNNSTVDQSCVKITWIVEYHNIKSRFSIRFFCLKDCMQNINDQRQTFNCISLWDERSEWDRESKNEAISANLLQLSAKWLIKLIINDWIRVQCDYINVHWIVRIHSKL